MKDTRPIIVWFRQDLRLSDNPALVAAANKHVPLLPIYILDDDDAGEWSLGGASRWWLHRSLEALHLDLGGHLRCFRGKADEILPRVLSLTGATGICWNRCYEPWRIARDRDIEAALRAAGYTVEKFNASLLVEPQSITKADGMPYKVFTPFYRTGCLGASNPPRKPLAKPRDIRFHDSVAGCAIAELELMPASQWYRGIAETWTPGEHAAQARMRSFLDQGIQHYKSGRDRPDQNYTSRLSPHLHWGEISPQQVWHALESHSMDNRVPGDIEHFRRELGWREFCYYLLYHRPELPRKNLQKRFDHFPWRDPGPDLERWQQGETGIPIVDAGMRELWRTGFMHNRVRMIAGSFLVKNLLLHWHHGENWFWDTLVDADLANNSVNWQWIAGCGADAAPYFRIFNPVLQGRKFDPDGAYVRRYVPEVAALPNRFIHNPWDAPADILEAAGVKPGATYPDPIVDLKTSRDRALEAYKRVRSEA